MRRRFVYLVLAAAVTALAVSSCRKESLSGEDGMVSVEFNVGGVVADSRMVSPSASSEAHIDRWALLLFAEQDSKLIACGTSGNASGIVCTIPAGNYFVRVVVNYPTAGDNAFVPQSVGTLNAYRSFVALLGSNAPGSLMMTGAETIAFTPSSATQSISVPVRRLVAKAGVERITTAFTNPAHAAKTFTVRKIYLTNVYTRTKLEQDYTPTGLPVSSSYWYNRMGLRADESAVAANDALLGDLAVNRVIANGTSYETPHYFYFYPNPVQNDRRSTSWTVRHSRLVVEASLDGQVYYYVVTLPASSRNRTYVVSEMRILQPGSITPEEETPYAMEVTFDTSTQGWQGWYNVQESS